MRAIRRRNHGAHSLKTLGLKKPGQVIADLTVFLYQRMRDYCIGKQPKTTRKLVAPTATGRKVVSPVTAPRVVTPKGKRTVTASRLRGVPTQGVSSAIISGHNYSAWRSGHRVRHGRDWRTFVALGALGAIAIGLSEYYPYAYISAPENYCEGLTEDGCELMWQDVETIEGDIIPQCVAYCPWQ